MVLQYTNGASIKPSSIWNSISLDEDIKFEVKVFIAGEPEFVSVDDIWSQIDALFGAWSHLEEDIDAWLDDVRHADMARLSELYDDEWE